MTIFITNNDTHFKEENRLQQISFLLTDIYFYLLGLQYNFPEEEMLEILSEIKHNEMSVLMIKFSFAYFALKKQLKNSNQYIDAENSMKELMGWEGEQKKKETEAVLMSGIGQNYLKNGNLSNAIKIFKEALKIDPDNPWVLLGLIQAYTEKGQLISAEKYRERGVRFFNEYDKNKYRIESKSMAKKKFQEYLKKSLEHYYDIETLYTQKPHYYKIFDKNEGILVQIQALLNVVHRYFKKKQPIVNYDKLPIILEDIMKIYFDWLSIISGVTYYMLKYNFGSQNQKNGIINALANILGYSSNFDLPSESEALEILQKNGRYSNIKENFKLKEIKLSLDGWGIPAVMDYEVENIRNQLQSPHEIVVKDEQISVEFNYPLSETVLLQYENKGGFTRLDLWRCIYEGYKKIYDKEDTEGEALGQMPKYALNRGKSNGKYGIQNHYMSKLFIEKIMYNFQNKTISMHIGS